MGAFHSSDTKVLRGLAARLRTIGDSPEMDRRRELWQRTNDLEPVECPPILIYAEGSWREIAPTLPVECQDPVAREFEHTMRRNLFIAEQFGDDSVINPHFESPVFISDTGYGVEIVHQTSEHAEGSWKPEPPLKDLARDLDRLRFRDVSHDREKTDRYFGLAREAFGDVLPVIQRSDLFWSLGMTGTVMDLLGMEEFMLLMMDEPDLHGVSVSPCADVARCAELCGRDYVLCCKPNPSHVAVTFAEDAVKADIDKILAPTAGNNIGILLKDLHTVSHDLRRYRRWSELAREAIRKHRKS